MQNAPRSSPRVQNIHRRRRRGLLLIVVLVIVVVVFSTHKKSDTSTANGKVFSIGDGKTVVVPNVAHLSSLRQKIVSLAEGQIGYSSDPANTYCNKFSAYWYSGTANCGNSNYNEQWCADFAAWAWKMAGATVVYQFVHGDLNSSSASFYEWGVAQGTWHAVTSGYSPLPGDVAVYGLNKSTLVAAHVAIVLGKLPGNKGPIAINGDGDKTGFSVVEVEANEFDADVHSNGAALAGYVSPN